MSDPYYDTLPFTLTEEQLNYDFVLFGTGLQGCLLAAHLSKVQHQKGLILELEKGYGGDTRTLSLKQLHEFMTLKSISMQDKAPLMFRGVLPQDLLQKNSQEVERRKQNPRSLRGYNIDIQPRVFCGSSFACEMMKEANMDQYMDFRVVNKVSFVLNGKLQEVPLSLKTILNAKGLGLMERKDLFRGVHQLIKIYYKFHEIEVDNNSTNEFDKDTDVDQELYDQFYKEKDELCNGFLLRVLNKKQRLLDMVMYGICAYRYKVPPKFAQKEYTCQQMLKKFGRFVKSCGVYSQTPYLYVDNGIGDVPQAYSRIAAIFGSTFILHPKIQVDKILRKEGTFQITTNLAPSQKVVTKTVQMSQTYFPYLGPKMDMDVQSFQENTLIVLLICKRPPGFIHKGPEIIHSFDDGNFLNPVTCFLLDDGSSCCPQDEYMVHFSTIVASTEKQHLDSQIKALMDLSGTLFGQQETVYVAAYISTNIHLENYGQYILKNDWSIDLEAVFEAFKSQAGQHPKYFKDESVLAHQPEVEQDYYSSLLNRLDHLKQKNQQTHLETAEQQEPSKLDPPTTSPSQTKPEQSTPPPDEKTEVPPPAGV